MSARKPFIGGNWKCNLNTASIQALMTADQATADATSFSFAAQQSTSGDHVDVVVAPPLTYLPLVKQLLKGWTLCAQNCSATAAGAFTGEVSAEMLLDVGCEWVILGHSERRKLYGETSAVVAAKIAAALQHKNGDGSARLRVIACVGETLEERQAGNTMQVVLEQLSAFKANIDPAAMVIAYEPVWAIGTGVTATPEQAQEVHADIRKWISSNVDPAAAALARIIYGGSVTSANCVSLAGQADIDGFLVGGASLKPAEFLPIIRSKASS